MSSPEPAQTAPSQGPPLEMLGPRSVERPADSGWTLVGALDDDRPSRVDGAGLVQAANAAWSIDWWIGADDRWYLPAKETTVRQQRMGAGPVLETMVRIPSGDAIHRAYPVSVGGRSATVIEIENDSPVPVALALAIRPYGLDGTPSHGPIAIHDDRVLVDGMVALCLPRRANERVATNRDAVSMVTSAESLTGAAEAAGERPNGLVLYPLPHRTSLRFVVPSLDGSIRPISPDQVPDIDAVMRGWTSVVDAGGRFDLPDEGLAQRSQGSRARLMIGSNAMADDVSALRPGAGRLLAARAASGAGNDVRMALLSLASTFPTRLDSSPEAAAAVVSGAGLGLAVLNDKGLADEILEVLAQITHLVERSRDKAASGEALRGLAWSLVAADQPEPATALFAKSAALFAKVASLGFADDVPIDLNALTALSEQASSSGSFGHDDVLEASRFWLGARRLVLEEHPSGIDLLPDFPSAWRGGSLEVHDARTVHGRVSFAIRWHGFRPALLWDTDLHRPVTLRCPGLDQAWNTIEPKGETLLEGVGDGLPEPPAAGDSFL